MKSSFFTGACTALVTPFLDHKVNYPMLEQLLRRQMEAGIKAVVLCGTTGESATLSDTEKLEIIRRGKNFVGNRCRIIAGTGSNSTEHAVALSKAAQQMGAEGLLVVTPYYNKATPEGLFAHYLSIAHAVTIPVILYNVPSRTGVDIPISIYQRLAQVPNIIGVKEASMSISKIARVIRETGPDFAVWSGNDDMTVPVISLGGQGVISVISNLYPEKVAAMADAALDGDLDTAAALQTQMLELCDLMFSEVNPIPVKAALNCMGYDCGGCRLPLTAPTQDTLQKIQAHFR